ncbi:MAG TPA: bifunctional pyr operon transcriptional regulator/uracil phosphoribosyltransferase PyrR [Longimicrobiales bacterium]|nr:bifunctional pyr operon transcriptional regulator/uracil phosphoribosyltransferase PyrR [Longimicrobiales bacterium]
MSAERISLMDDTAVHRAVARMAREIVERTEGCQRLVLMGIHRRGVQIATLLRQEIEGAEGVKVSSGSIDISLYRDDLEAIGPRPIVAGSQLPVSGIDGHTIVLVDDVQYTGRTARAAINELMDWGRPARILLCVLVDRGGRELPIQPDIVGRHVDVLDAHQSVEVLVPELDGRLGVDLVYTHTEAV